VGAVMTAEIPFCGNSFVKATWRACHGKSWEISLSTSVLMEKRVTSKTAAATINTTPAMITAQ
jgi:hypothetical protein